MICSIGEHHPGRWPSSWWTLFAAAAVGSAGLCPLVMAGEAGTNCTVATFTVNDTLSWAEALRRASNVDGDAVISFDPALAAKGQLAIALIQPLTLSSRRGSLEIDGSRLAAPVVFDASRCENSAVMLEEQSVLSLRHVIIRGAGQRNLLLKDHASLRMERVTIEASQGPGLALYGDARAELTDCQVTANQTHGIELHDRAVVRVIGGGIAHNRQAGISAFQDSRMTMQGLTLETSGQWHLFVTDRAHAELDQCRLAGTTFAGLDLSQSAEADVRNSVIADSGRFGIFATGQSRVRLAGTQLRKAGYRGLELQDDASGVLDQCRVESCADYGAILFGQSRLDASTSVFSYNGAHAVSLREHAAGSFADCSFAGNRYGGIGCLDGQNGGRVTVRHSVFHANGMRPIYRGPFHLDPPVPTPLGIRNRKVICQAAPQSQIDLFADQAGEASEYLYSLQADDKGLFEVNGRDLPPGRVITASATVHGATSEFNVVAGADNEPLLAALLGQTGPLSDNGPEAGSESRTRCWPRGTRLVFQLAHAPSPTINRYGRAFAAQVDTWTLGAIHAEFRGDPAVGSDRDGVLIPIHYMPASDPQLEGVGGVTLMRWTLDGYFVKPMEILLAEASDPQDCCPRILAHEIGHTLGLGHARVGLLSRMQGTAVPTDPHLVNDFSPTMTYYDVQALGLLYGAQHKAGMTLAELIPDYAAAASNRVASIHPQPTFSPQPPSQPKVSSPSR